MKVLIFTGKLFLHLVLFAVFLFLGCGVVVGIGGEFPLVGVTLWFLGSPILYMLLVSIVSMIRTHGSCGECSDHRAVSGSEGAEHERFRKY
ncbi:hypothetical protein JD969_15745 [Planctomycetota bacterium]|nr:hypothetical protein JD969_15745 [Planctomycetota bacterium]